MTGRGWLLLLAFAAVAASDEPTQSVRLEGIPPGPALRRNFGPSSDDPPLKTRRGTVRGQTCLFFDVDGNGEYDDAGVDGWALAEMGFMLPLEPETALGAMAVHWTIAIDGTELSFREEPFGMERPEQDALAQLNTLRARNGLPPVKVDPRISDACRKHCRYMARHGIGHDEDPSKEFYSPDGEKAAKRSCLAQASPESAVQSFYASFYHRLPLVDPSTRAVGIAGADGFAAIDASSRRTKREWHSPVIVPAPDAVDQPTDFAMEVPQPYPDGMRPGLPITLTFSGGKVTGARAEMGVKGAGTVPVLVFSPEKPANPARPDNRNSILVLPRERLAPGVTYWVKVGYSLDGEPYEHEWTFSTARGRRTLDWR